MKSDADEFKDFLNELGKQSWLGKQRSIWVSYSFHFTDVRNASQILNMEKIVSRAKLEKMGGPPVDIASPEVIATTDGEIKDFVRLYFRPRTPTQFHMEGIRPKAEIWKGCHCPVPVFFLFDSLKILTRDDSSLSEVNLAIFGTTRWRTRRLNSENLISGRFSMLDGSLMTVAKRLFHIEMPRL